MSTKPTPLSWNELLDSPEQRVEFLLDPYIPQQGVVLLHGRKSLGKSPLGWTVGLSIASGRPWCSFPTKQSVVLYIEVDTPQIAVVPRLKLLQDLYPKDTPFHALFLGGINILRPSSKALVALASAAELKPSLVIVNTTRRVAVGLDFNASETPSLVYGALQGHFPGAALLFVHHDRKVQKDSTPEMEREDLSGSLAWANDAQVVLHLMRHGRTPGTIRLDHTGSQVSELHPPLLIRLDEDGSHLHHLDAEWQEDAARVLASLPRGATPHQKDLALAEHFGCSLRTAQRRRLTLLEKV